MEVRQAETKNPAEVLGARLLKDIEREQESLESLLKDLRSKQPIQTSKTGIPELDDLWKQYGAPKLSIFGRGLPLLYHLIFHQVQTLNGTVVLVDIAGTFSPSHLKLSREELKHIHVFRPNKGNLKQTMEGLEDYMLWGEASVGSRGREWVGTLVNGGVGGGDINVGWRGWLRIEREGMDRERFGAGVSVEEAVTERERRLDGHVEGQRAVSWRALSEVGEFLWREG